MILDGGTAATLHCLRGRVKLWRDNLSHWWYQSAVLYFTFTFTRPNSGRFCTVAKGDVGLQPPDEHILLFNKQMAKLQSLVIIISNYHSQMIVPFGAK